MKVNNLADYERRAKGYVDRGKREWAEGNYQVAIVILKKGIQVYDYLIEQDTYLKDSYIKNRKGLAELINTSLEQIDDKMKKKKKVTNTNGGGGGKPAPSSGGGSKGGEDEGEDEYKKALSGAIVHEKPDVKWSDVSGLEEAKTALKEAVILPIKFPDMFKDGLIKPWKGILMYGPPGTGKTFLAKACATEANAQFYSISSSDLISKYVGQSEKLIRALFTMARETKPSIIFIDEIDSMCGSRDESANEASKRVITEFLVQMQGVGHDDTGVLILGATNIPWSLDAAIRRRFQRRIYISLPEPAARSGILKGGINKSKGTTISASDLQKLTELTDGYSGSDLAVLIKKAAYIPLHRMQKAQFWVANSAGKYTPATQTTPDAVRKTMMDFNNEDIQVPALNYDDFIEALKSCKPSVDKKGLGKYVEWTASFGEES